MAEPGERARLVGRLGVSFDDPTLLEQALAHRSFCAEQPDTESNERLEFLGDAVLGLVVTDFLYREYPDLPEGQLAKVRASVVNAEVLATVAHEVELGPALMLGRGEDLSGGRAKTSILADATEAVIAAVYLDRGGPAATDLVLQLLGARIEAAAAGPGGDDFKTRLQEAAARVYERLPRYQVRDEGPDHAKRFFATVLLGGEPRGSGEGRSKKQAEQAAARAAWLWLRSWEALPDPVPPEGDDEPAAGAEPVRPGVGGHDAGAT